MNTQQAKQILEDRFVPSNGEMLYEFISDKEIFEALLINGVSPNSSENSSEEPILSLAFSLEEYQAFKLLLDHGADPNIKTSTNYSSEAKWPLIFSIVNDHPRNIRFFKKIIKHDIDYSVLDENKGNTLMHVDLLSSTSSLKMISFLAEKGVDPLIKNKEGKTVLDIAQEAYESSSWNKELQQEQLQIITFLKQLMHEY